MIPVSPALVHGFSLVELAMVLFIISLVVGGLLVPLATQLEARQRSDTQARLEEIREALIGFAIINGRLPCPSSSTDPADDDDSDGFAYGIEDANCNGITAGYLPWKSLGVAQYDSWGVNRTSSGELMTGYWRYIVDSKFSCPNANSGPLPKTCDDDADPDTNDDITLASAPSDALEVQDAGGTLLTSASETPVAIIFSTGAKDLGNEDGDDDAESNKADGENDDSPADNIYQGGTVTTVFDDITIWITRPILFARMVSAGTLP